MITFSDGLNSRQELLVDTLVTGKLPNQISRVLSWIGNNTWMQRMQCRYLTSRPVDAPAQSLWQDVDLEERRQPAAADRGT